MVNPRVLAKFSSQKCTALISSAKTCLFFCTINSSQVRTRSSLSQSHLEPLKALSVTDPALGGEVCSVLTHYKKRGQCEYIRPRMNTGAWQCYIQTGSGSAERGGWKEEGGYGRPRCGGGGGERPPLSLWNGPEWTEFPVWSTNPTMHCERASEAGREGGGHGGDARREETGVVVTPRTFKNHSSGGFFFLFFHNRRKY